MSVFLQEVTKMCTCATHEMCVLGGGGDARTQFAMLALLLWKPDLSAY